MAEEAEELGREDARKHAERRHRRRQAIG